MLRFLAFVGGTALLATLSACPVPCEKTLTCGDGADGDGGTAGAPSTGGGDLLPNGDACDAAAACDSGHCVDGLCCESACDGVCESCAIGGSEGVCAAVPDGEVSSEGECGLAACDGMGACLDMPHRWSLSFGASPGEELLARVASDGSGLVMAGVVRSESYVGLGGNEMIGPGIALAKYGPSGNHLWSRIAPLSGYNAADVSALEVYNLAVAADGSIALTGRFGYTGTIDFGSGALSPAAGERYVAVFDGDGEPRWSRSATPNMLGIAIADNGNVVVAGNVSSGPNTTMDAVTLSGSWQHFRFDLAASTGIAVSGALLGTPSSTSTIWSLSVDPQPTLVAGGPLIAALDAEDEIVWSQEAQGDADYLDAVRSGDRYVACGVIEGVASVGGHTVQSNGGRDHFVASGSMTDGSVDWVAVVGSDGDEPFQHCGVAVDSAGDVVLVTTLVGTTAYIAGDDFAIDGDDVAIVKLKPDGSLRSHRTFSAPGVQIARDVAISSDGAITIVGRFDTAFSFGGTVLTPAGGADMFVATFGP